MFKALRDSLFWNEDFDREWSFYYEKFLDYRNVPFAWSTRLKEKRAYWREYGRRQNMPATHALFRALLDTAEDFFGEMHQDPRMTDVWPKLADHLLFAATLMGDIPGVPLPINRLPERWRDIYSAAKHTT